MTGDGMRRGLADTIISDYGEPTVWLRHDYRIWYRCSGISSNGETAIFHTLNIQSRRSRATLYCGLRMNTEVRCTTAPLQQLYSSMSSPTNCVL